MRPVRYNVAASLDGFIAGPRGEFDWIPDDPAVDFGAIFARVDTVLLGRRSWELVREMGTPPWPAGTRVYVFSRGQPPDLPAGATLVRENGEEVVEALRRESGDGDIWLFGGGELFRSLLAAGQVDLLEITVVPVMLGGGVPLIAPGAPRTRLRLTGTHTYPSGMVTLSYAVESEAPK